MKTLFEVFIIDDNKSSIDSLRMSLEGRKQFFVSGFSESATEGRKRLFLKRPDLLFLDIELRECSGFEFLDSIKDQLCWPMQVVFYTAYDKYMLQALRASAFDYLLKPFSEKELDQILSRFLDDPFKKQMWLNKLDLVSNTINTDKTFMIPVARGHQFIKMSQICFFEYRKSDRCWFLNTSDGSSIKLKHEIKAVNILKLVSNCMRISQTHIVNPEYLSRYDGVMCYLSPPHFSDKGFPVSRDCCKNLRNRFVEM